MRDHKARQYASRHTDAKIDDPVFNAVMAAESARSAGGYADVPGYMQGDGGIPVRVSMGYYLDRDSSTEGWRVQVSVPSNAGGDRNVARYYDDEFSATAVFEWLIATYDLDEEFSFEEEEDDVENEEDEDDTAEDEESSSDGRWGLFD